MHLRNISYRNSVLLTTFVISSLVIPRGAGSAPFKKPCRWRYIVIHHSATRKGNAAILGRYHSNRRHMANGLAYHFVIGNGTSGCADGDVEESYRWRAQLPGGHAKQPWLNESGIGICLVGNFNRQAVTKKQMTSLVKLVNRLRATYDIPLGCIKGHGEFNGERTMCPGHNFPTKRFKERLKKTTASFVAEDSVPPPRSKKKFASSFQSVRGKGIPSASGH